jgi:hypothetical protein
MLSRIFAICSNFTANKKHYSIGADEHCAIGKEVREMPHKRIVARPPKELIIQLLLPIWLKKY